MLNDDKKTESNIGLWKYFTDDAAKIKDRMWTVASFLYTLLGAMLSYVAKYFHSMKKRHFP